ncbi:hypothetical protein tb265_10890 [Gemmatimonadetes bacterium T265]|nr:hypothetical protein tb265_10890 [Gemmatimonadetes bacterium T265]
MHLPGELATQELITAGREAYVGLSMVNLALKMTDRVAALELARTGVAHATAQMQRMEGELRAQRT